MFVKENPDRKKWTALKVLAILVPYLILRCSEEDAEKKMDSSEGTYYISTVPNITLF